MVTSIVRKALALLVPAAACALVAGCDWFAGGDDQGGATDGGASTHPSGSDAAPIGFDAGAPTGDAGVGADGEVDAEAGADVEAGAASEAGDAAEAGGDAACAGCLSGCFAGACTGPLTAIGGTSAALTTGTAVTLVQTTANGTSTGGGPVAHTDGVTITTTTQPGGEYVTVSVTWSLDPTVPPTSASTPVTMTLKSSAQATDTWTGVIPAQAAGSEVYFYVWAKPALGTTLYDPTSFVHYAYAVN